jgi:hypothetical protein
MIRANHGAQIGLVLTVAVVLGTMIRPARAGTDLIAGDNFDSALNLNSFTQDPPFHVVDGNWTAGDWFGVLDPTDPPGPLPGGSNRGMPYSIADDSVSVYPLDLQGVVDNSPDSNATTFTSGFKSDKYFGVTDLENPNFTGTARATWVFDISGATELTEISIDMGAMGDFESENDRFDWEYQIDGGPAVPLFTSMVDEEGAATYVMANGTEVNLDDPLMINDVPLLTDKTTVSGLPTRAAAISGSGSELALFFEAETNGGTEAYVFDNIQIIGETGSEVLLGDVNLDSDVNGLDVDPFVGLVTSGGYQAEADMNQDDAVNGLDVDPFVAAIVGGDAQPVPEPSALNLVLLALAGLTGSPVLRWRRASTKSLTRRSSRTDFAETRNDVFFPVS